MTLLHFLKYHRFYEIGCWVSFILTENTLKATSQLTEYSRTNRALEIWEPFVWEYSSGLVWLLLIAVLVWVNNRFPINSYNWRTRLGWHVMGAIAAGLIHTTGFVMLRKLAYYFQGSYYDFGDVSIELVYELRKQMWGYLQILVAIYAYRFILARLRSEASFPGVSEEQSQTPDRPERFLVKKLGKEFLVSVSNIDWIEASGNYVNLHVGNRIYPLRGTMSALEKTLDPAQFIRVHRSSIVNVERISQIEPQGSGEAQLCLTDGTQIAVSRGYRNRLRPV